MNTSRVPDAIVVGCGIAGPVVAMALQRVGIRATIFEAYERPADHVGSFLNLACNGIDALRTLGAEGPVLREAFPTPRLVMWSGTGKRLGEVLNGIALEDGTTSQTILRGALHRALRDEAIHRAIRIVPGKRLVSTRNTATGVTAVFSDGTDAHATFLVGADGLGSVCRTLIDAAAASPRDTGQVSVSGCSVNPGLAPTPDAFHMIFGRRAFFGYTVRPSGDVHWFANVGSRDVPDEGVEASPRTVTWCARLRELFEGDAEPASRIVTATSGDVVAYAIADMPAVEHWHAGSMVLVGDAAHATSPSSGQGASLAIEDALILARHLRDSNDLRAAFSSYEHVRRPRVERVVRYSKRLTHTKLPGPVGRWLRDLSMPVALRLFAGANTQEWLYAHHIELDSPVSANANRP